MIFLLPILILQTLFQACSPAWEMTADKERACNSMPYHVWKAGRCERVR